MPRPDIPGFDTLAIHAGSEPDPATGAVVPPVYRSASFAFDDTEHAAALFDLATPGHIYSRISNPTVSVFEERMAALEGGVGSVATASGQAALHLAVSSLMGAGGHVVCSSQVYGGTANLLLHSMPRFGVTTTFVDPRDHNGIRAAITDETRVVIGETIGNPTMSVLDIEAVAGIAHEASIPLLVDNTFASPYLCRPFEWGADLVFHSATKFIGGHGAVIGGVLVDSGRFDWVGSGKFPLLDRPEPAYHDMVFAEEFGVAAFIVRARADGLRDFGACMAADVASAMITGLETLPVRMQRHVDNARRVAGFLDAHDAVGWVAYPDLPLHPDHSLTARMLPRGAGAILAFGIEGGRQAGVRFIESLELFSHLANVGDLRSLVIHPASTTHRQLDDRQLEEAGIGPELIRLSIGLEDPGDLIADLDRALTRSQRNR